MKLTKMDEERVNESDFATKLVKDFCTTKTGLGLGLSVAGDSDLDIDKIVSLFDGCRENADYFFGLWQAVKAIGGDKMADYSCDPRDERKRLRVGSWKPAIRDGRCVDFVSEVDEVEALAVKQTVVEDEKTTKERRLGTNNNETSDDLEDTESKRFHCGVYGCGEILSSLASYEAHYHHCHSYTCASCRRVFVSNFLLDIHLQENHDSYFAVLSPRIDMYRCLVESCEVKFRTAELRKDHLIASHKFPSNFSFHQPLHKPRAKTKATKATKAKGTTKLSTQPSSMDSQTTGMDIGGGGGGSDVSSHPALNVDDDCAIVVAMDTELPPEASPASSSSSSSNRKSKNEDKHTGRNSANSQTKKVPSSVCFGRGSQRAFQQHRGGRGRGGVRGRNWYQTTSCLEADTAVDIKAVDMTELATALT